MIKLKCPFCSTKSLIDEGEIADSRRGFTCPQCGHVLGVPSPAAETAAGTGALSSDDLAELEEGRQADGAAVCPKCLTELATEDVVCVKCGYDLRKGRRQRTQIHSFRPSGAESFAKKIGGGLSGLTKNIIVFTVAIGIILGSVLTVRFLLRRRSDRFLAKKIDKMLAKSDRWTRAGQVGRAYQILDEAKALTEQFNQPALVRVWNHRIEGRGKDHVEDIVQLAQRLFYQGRQAENSGRYSSAQSNYQRIIGWSKRVPEVSSLAAKAQKRLNSGSFQGGLIAERKARSKRGRRRR